MQLAEKHLIQIFSWDKENPPPSQKDFLDRDYTHISSKEVQSIM